MMMHVIDVIANKLKTDEKCKILHIRIRKHVVTNKLLVYNLHFTFM